jgi:hypothetical protein
MESSSSSWRASYRLNGRISGLVPLYRPAGLG